MPAGPLMNARVRAEPTGTRAPDTDRDRPMVATLPAVSTFPPIVSDAVEGAAAAFFRGSCGMTHVPDAEIDDTADTAAIMSSISFVGDLQWAFALAFPEEAAVGIARTFAGFDIPFDSPDMGDVIGEIVNVIAGDVVGRLAKQKFVAQMSLPTTVRGSNVAMLTPSDASTTRFVFTGPAGTCSFNLVSSPNATLVPDREPNQEQAPDHTTARLTAEPPAERAEPAPAATPTQAAEPDPAQDAWAAAMAEAERQMAEQDAADAAARAAGLATGGATQAPPTVVRSGSKLMPLVLVFACAGWGSLLGVLGTSKPPVAPADATAQAEQPAAPKAPTADIDELIRNEQYGDALKACLTAAKATPAPSETELALREGLCLEGQGRWGEATDSYRRAEADPDAVAAVLAILGQARCATQDGSYVIARALTNRALLRSGNPGCRGLPVLKEVHHLQARIALQTSGAKPLPRDASARPLLSASGANGADWLMTGPAHPAPKHDLFEVHRTLGTPKALQVTGSLSRRPAADVIGVLATTAGWKVQANAATNARLKWAVGPIEVDHLPLAEFLNVLTEGTGVSWTVNADAILLTESGHQEPASK